MNGREYSPIANKAVPQAISAGLKVNGQSAYPLTRTVLDKNTWNAVTQFASEALTQAVVSHNVVQLNRELSSRGFIPANVHVPVSSPAYVPSAYPQYAFGDPPFIPKQGMKVGRVILVGIGILALLKYLKKK